MKKFRKVLSLVLAMIMVVTTFTLASATEMTTLTSAEKTTGEKLQELGIILGSDGGSLLEDENLTREQAATIIARVLVLNVDLANKTCKYVDVAGTWSAPYVNALIEANITAGISDIEFGAKEYITEFDFYVWLYRALNGGTAEDLSKDVYNNPELFVTSGLLAAEEVAAMQEDKAAGKNATRGDIFDGSFKVSSENKEIAKKQMEAYNITEEKALDLGLIEEEKPVKNEIVKAEALNFAEIKLTWSVKANTDAACYSVSHGGDITKDCAVNVEDVSDTEVILSFVDIDTKKMAAQTTAEVKFNAEKDGFEDDKVDQKITTNEVFDTTAPTVVAVEQSGKNSFTVKFSEFVKYEDINVLLNNGMVAITKATAPVIPDGDEVSENDEYEKYVKELQFTAVGAGLTDKTTYTVKVTKGVTDVAALAMKSDAILTFTYAEVATPVEVTVKSATPTEIVLELSAATTKTLRYDQIENFSYIFANTNPSSITLGEDKKTITLTLDDYNAPENADGWDLKISKADEMFVDEWGNTTAEKEFTVKFFPVADKTAPTVTKVELSKDQQKITFTFDEEVEVLEEELSVTVRKGDIDKTDNFYRGYEEIREDKKTFIIYMNSENYENSDYTVTIKGLEDESGNKLKEYTTTITAKKLGYVSLFAVHRKNEGNKIKELHFTFSSEMNEATLDKANWVIATSDGKYTAKIKSIAFSKSGSARVIVALDSEAENQLSWDKVPVEGLTLTLASAVKDINGNTFERAEDFESVLPAVGKYSIFPVTLINVWDHIEFQAVGPQKINLVISKGANIDLTTIKATTFMFSAGEGYHATVAKMSAPQEAADGTVTFEMDVTPFRDGMQDNVYTISSSATLNIYDEALWLRVNSVIGEEMKTLDDGSLFNTAMNDDFMGIVVKDKIAPTQVGVAIESFDSKLLALQINFSEALKEVTTSLLAAELVVKCNGVQLVPGLDYVTMSAHPYIVGIQIINEDAKFLVTDKIEVSLAKESAFVTDISNNKLQPFSVSLN